MQLQYYIIQGRTSREQKKHKLWASPPNLKIPYIINKKENEVVRKSNTYMYKLLVMIENCTMLLCPSNMWAIRIKAPYLIRIKISAMFLEARHA